MSRARDLADAGGLINVLDGLTATSTELNKLDGATASTAEINFLTGVTESIQTQLDAGSAASDVAAYIIKSDFTAPVYFKKVDIIPNNTTVAGTWEWFADAEVWVSELTTISSNGEYLTATESKSNHLFFGTAYVGDDAVVTVTDTMQGLGDPASGGSFSRTSLKAENSGSLGSLSYNSATTTYTYTAPSIGKIMFLGGI